MAPSIEGCETNDGTTLAVHTLSSDIDFLRVTSEAADGIFCCELSPSVLKQELGISRLCESSRWPVDPNLLPLHSLAHKSRDAIRVSLPPPPTCILPSTSTTFLRHDGEYNCCYCHYQPFDRSQDLTYCHLHMTNRDLLLFDTFEYPSSYLSGELSDEELEIPPHEIPPNPDDSDS